MPDRVVRITAPPAPPALRDRARITRQRVRERLRQRFGPDLTVVFYTGSVSSVHSDGFDRPADVRAAVGDALALAAY